VSNSKKPARKQSSPRPAGRKASGKPAPKKAAAPAKKFPLFPVLFGVGAVLLIVAITLTFNTSSGEFGEPTAAGTALPPFEGNPQEDAAIGLSLPTVSGADFDGNPVTIAPTGTPKAILMASHWCDVCRQEIPDVQAWVNQGGLPDGIELVTVVTLTNSARPNYPPSEWLEREGWTAPVIVDDADGTVAAAFGLTGVPAWVFTDGSGNVVLRSSGLTDLPVLEAFLSVLATGPPG
jgi:hypothetical protein